MLALPRELTPALRLTPAQFAELCAANPEAVLELGPGGNLIERPPAGGETGRRNSRLLMRLQLWADLSRAWCVFDSCTGFLLPESRCVEVWPEKGEPQIIEAATTLEGAPLLAGLRLDLRELWDA
jgi:Uma2 family endonuclease